MQENRDSQVTTDQQRSGGFQTTDPDVSQEDVGQGSSNKNPDSRKEQAAGQGLDGGYGKQSGQAQGQKQPGGQGMATKMRQSGGGFEPQEPQAQYSEDDADQGGRSDSKESQQEWSPGSDMPNT